jgi:SAM-dependent methyltransferase
MHPAPDDDIACRYPDDEPIQAQLFSAGEGDAWLRRNRDHLEAFRLEDDHIFRAVQAAGLTPQRILDLGCSLGTRLSSFCSHFRADGLGIDPSTEAIAEAQARDPDRDWQIGTIDHFTRPDGTFDLVILSFVLHWVDRRLLLSSLAAIDACVGEHGCVVIADFLPDFHQRRPYHHLPDHDVYTYKADYAAMLTATGLYRPLLRQTLVYPAFTPPVPGCIDTRAQVAVLERLTTEDIPIV